MKIHNKDGSVVVSGIQEQQNFKISEESSKMIIDSLINLYSDPIGSVIRELVSNAVDANRERDLKISGEMPLEPGIDDIKFLATDKPQVEVSAVKENKLLGIQGAINIKDWGNGLSPERVRKVFTVFGNSTKRSTDNLIGGYGIGAKSVFAYTDTFYVKAAHNGVERTYMLYYGNELPSMDLVSESTTTEPNNTTVTIPLKSSYDLSEFEDKIKTQLRFFSNVVYSGFSAINKTITPEIVYEDEDIIFYEGEGNLKILIGRVEYPLNTSEVPCTFSKMPALLRFKIGELDLVPSRESLRYTDKTKKAIEARLGAVTATALDYLQKSLNTSTDLIEHYSKYKTISNVSSYNVSLTKGEFFKACCFIYNCLGNKKLSLKALSGYNNHLYEILESYISLSFEVKEVTSPSSRRKTITPYAVETSTLQHLFNELVKGRKVYYVENNYAESKNSYLWNNGGATIFKFSSNYPLDEYPNNVRSWNKKTFKEADLLEVSQQIFKYLSNHPKVLKYDDIVNTSYQKPEKERRANGIFPYKELVMPYNSTYCLLEDLEFRMVEGNLDEISDTVIYGSQEDEQALKLAFLVVSRYKPRVTYNNSSGYSSGEVVKGYKILKVSKQLEKKLTGFIHVTDFFIEQYPEVKKFYTSYKLSELGISKVIEIYENVKGGIEGDADKIFTNLIEESAPFLKHVYISIPNALEEELKELCELSTLYDKTLIARLAEIVKFINTAPMLKYCQLDRYAADDKVEKFNKDIKDYITLINPKIDINLVPLPDLQELTKEKELETT